MFSSNLKPAAPGPLFQGPGGNFFHIYWQRLIQAEIPWPHRVHFWLAGATQNNTLRKNCIQALIFFTWVCSPSQLIWNRANKAIKLLSPSLIASCCLT